MVKEFSRIQRINQQVQRELAIVLQREIKDPRLGMVTVTEVDVSKDLNYAKVYVTFFGLEDKPIEEKIGVLNHAMPYIRSLMASRVNLRVVPEFRFLHDHSLNEGVRMSSLTTAAVRSDEAKKSKKAEKEQGNDE